MYAAMKTGTAEELTRRIKEESNRRVLPWIEENVAPPLVGPTMATAGPVIVHTLA